MHDSCGKTSVKSVDINMFMIQFICSECLFRGKKCFLLCKNSYYSP